MIPPGVNQLYSPTNLTLLLATKTLNLSLGRVSISRLKHRTYPFRESNSPELRKMDYLQTSLPGLNAKQGITKDKQTLIILIALNER